MSLFAIVWGLACSCYAATLIWASYDEPGNPPSRQLTLAFAATFAAGAFQSAALHTHDYGAAWDMIVSVIIVPISFIWIGLTVASGLTAPRGWRVGVFVVAVAGLLGSFALG